MKQGGVVMIIMCAWCNTIKDVIEDGSAGISHGMCEECAKAMAQDIEELEAVAYIS
jgi:hypothetical protein